MLYTFTLERLERANQEPAYRGRKDTTGPSGR